MSDKDQHQIKQMVSFIMKEADQKVAEIENKTQQDAHLLKNQHIQDGHDKLNEEFDARRRAIAINHRIAHSELVKDARSEVLNERIKLIRQVEQKLEARLQARVADSSSYPHLLGTLVTEGLLRISSPKCQVLCRKADQAAVRDCIANAVATAGEKLGFEVSATVADETLEEGAIGGVVVRSADRTLVCDNTLLKRKEQLLQERASDVRSLLFAEVAAELLQSIGAI
eukprot:TRINITY_DN57701_c0_g1_i1.p1 TRINITY_DN57701_c0_g1~~TRINITY_DN57701_c0_g1_i1.p1  ORF type:complete len:227 (-),score=57.18 TRINITY_DN57701_c0_g1_i1:215-895(-)